jgi:hypothetical protein
MSTKFDIEVTLVELINNNFLLFKNDLKLLTRKILWITHPENVLRVLVLHCCFAAARRLRCAIPLTLAKYHFLD